MEIKRRPDILQVCLEILSKSNNQYLLLFISNVLQVI